MIQDLKGLVLKEKKITLNSGTYIKVSYIQFMRDMKNFEFTGMN